jgi:hypothetical protein
MSEKIEELRVLVNQKMKFDKAHDVCMGLHYTCMIMLFYYIVVEGGLNPFLMCSFLAFITGYLGSYFEKKSLEVKMKISSSLFKE